MTFGGLVLGTAITLTCFQAWGTMPCRTDALKIAQTGSANHGENSRRNQFGMSSGPLALYRLMAASLCST